MPVFCHHFIQKDIPTGTTSVEFQLPWLELYGSRSYGRHVGISCTPPAPRRWFWCFPSIGTSTKQLGTKKWCHPTAMSCLLGACFLWRLYVPSIFLSPEWVPTVSSNRGLCSVVDSATLLFILCLSKGLWRSHNHKKTVETSTSYKQLRSPKKAHGFSKALAFASNQNIPRPSRNNILYKEITSFIIPVNTVKTNNFTILYPCFYRFRFLHVGLLVSLPNKNTSLVTTKEKKVAGGMLRSPQSTLTHPLWWAKKSGAAKGLPSTGNAT